ncbi:ROK family transcriptional regulator [Cellulomonas sp. P24]|uniref:ROK family transcriptional regulator n=1 Tax=Cellulomonas sp. P24 TaxID=2885206 RepID=UPI00216B0413|nr:ROK family transcriptional regulator [Cellulomonas sp. P24]MCR6492217.1 ROK family transcriptional regulator [Cellulomonas sp. P24]
MTPSTHHGDRESGTGTVGDVLWLIRSKVATSRSEIARHTGLSPSTVGLRVESLQRLGLVTEDGALESRGGRRARHLRIASTSGYVVAIEPGVRVHRVAIADLEGVIVGATRLDARAGETPAEAVSMIWDAVKTMTGPLEVPTERIRGVAVGLPAPVEQSVGRAVLPSFLQTWSDVVVPDLFVPHTDALVLVENDANLVAISEMSDGDRSGDYFLAVLLGRRIGSGIVAGGALLRGVNGAAGEFSHSPAAASAAIRCVCGIENCLESTASGAAIAAQLAELGYELDTPRDIVALGQSGDPRVVAVLREAGSHIGAALAGVVNFMNPGRVILAGSLSQSAPLVASVRAELFQRCLPIAAQNLVVSATTDPDTAGARGAFRLLLDEVLAPARVDEMARVAGDEPSRSA